MDKASKVSSERLYGTLCTSQSTPDTHTYLNIALSWDCLSLCQKESLEGH